MQYTHACLSASKVLFHKVQPNVDRMQNLEIISQKSRFNTMRTRILELMICSMLLSGPNCNFRGQNSGEFQPEFFGEKQRLCAELSDIID